MSETSGSETGLGDVIFRSKYHLLERVRFDPLRGYFRPDVAIFLNIDEAHLDKVSA